MRRVMFLLDNYMPNSSPNGVCVENISKCLAQNGCEVSIVCFKIPGEPEIEIQDNITIHRVCDSGVFHKNTKIDAIKFYFKWFIPSRYPITERKEVTKQLYEGADQLLSIKKYDVVICVHLPIETLIAGVYLKEKYPNTIFISYMLDSLSGGFIPRFLPEKFTRKRKLIWENNIFEKLDHVILMSSSKNHHNQYSLIETWIDKAIYLDVPLLMKKSISCYNKSNYDKTTITFCGLLNDPYRHVKHFIEIAKKCKHYNFIFAGSSNIEIELLQAQNETESNIVYLGLVQHSKIEKILSESDILLNLGVAVPSAISGKIFEYMSYGKPIVSTYFIDNEACIPYLNKYRLGLLIDERCGSIEQQAEVFCNFVEQVKGKRIDYETVEKTFYLNTPQAFIDTLSKIVYKTL